MDYTSYLREHDEEVYTDLCYILHDVLLKHIQNHYYNSGITRYQHDSAPRVVCETNHEGDLDSYWNVVFRIQIQDIPYIELAGRVVERGKDKSTQIGKLSVIYLAEDAVLPEEDYFDDFQYNTEEEYNAGLNDYVKEVQRKRTTFERWRNAIRDEAILARIAV